MSYYKLLGMNKEPFSTSPDPSFFFLSKEHKAALCRLQIAISLKRGLSVLLGDVGTGKTTLSRKISQTLSNDSDIIFRMILNPYFRSEKQFLAKIAQLFHIDLPKESTELEYIEAIEKYLFAKGVEEEKTIVLLIDESQILPDFVLETLRILLNYETNEYKILQLVLVGQMELLPRISKMSNFWDRIALKCVLNPLDISEIKDVIDFRLRQAGNNGRKIFSQAAIEKIWQHTQGYPRKLSMLCHDCLEFIVMHDKKVVDLKVVNDVVDSQLKPVGVIEEIDFSDDPENILNKIIQAG